MKSVEFFFRVSLLYGDIEEIKVWYHGLDIIKPGQRSLEDWAEDSFRDQVTPSDLFPDKNSKYLEGCWQAYGKARIEGYWSGFDSEYTEDIIILDIKIQEDSTKENELVQEESYDYTDTFWDREDF